MKSACSCGNIQLPESPRSQFATSKKSNNSQTITPVIYHYMLRDGPLKVRYDYALDQSFCLETFRDLVTVNLN